MAEEKSTQKVSIQIPQSIFDKAQKRCGEEFASVSDYLTFILEQVFSKMEKAAENSGGNSEKTRENVSIGNSEKAVFSKEEEEKVKDRLKSLGYL